MQVFKKAIGYISVSAEQHALDDKFGVDVQKQAILLYANDNGYNIVDWKIDEMSGAKDDRPALKQILDTVKNGNINAIIVFKLDILSKKQRNLLNIIENGLLKNNVNLISLREALDTSTPWGRALIGILSSFSQLESDNINVRAAVGRYTKAERGGYAGGKPPLGYKAVEGQLVIVPEEAEIVQLTYELRKQGMPMIAIADELNRRGYRSKKGNEFKHSAVQTILNNESTYRGHYKYGNAQCEKTHEPILKKEE